MASDKITTSPRDQVEPPPAALRGRSFGMRGPASLISCSVKLNNGGGARPSGSLKFGSVTTRVSLLGSAKLTMASTTPTWTLESEKEGRSQLCGGGSGGGGGGRAACGRAAEHRVAHRRTGGHRPAKV